MSEVPLYAVGPWGGAVSYEQGTPVQVRTLGRTIDAIVCNAAVWYPLDKEPRLTVRTPTPRASPLSHDFIIHNVIIKQF